MFHVLPLLYLVHSHYNFPTFTSSTAPILFTSQGHFPSQASEQLQQGALIWSCHMTHCMYHCSPDNTHLCANLSRGGFYSNIQLLSNIHLHKNAGMFTIDLLYSYPIKQQHHHVQESVGAFYRRVTARQYLMGQQEATRSAVVLHLHLQR